MKHLTQAIADRVVDRAEAKARELNVNVCIAVTDQGAHLKAFRRMDQAFTGSVDVAIGKARTSSLFPLPSGQFGELIRNEQLTGMELSNQGMVAFAGGHPLKLYGRPVGAIGISGASAEQDAAIAEYAVAELQS